LWVSSSVYNWFEKWLIHSATDAALLDAGSTMTCLYMFKWKKWVEGTSVLQIEEVYNKKMDPGL
jgi:hypothetical protein